MINKENRVTSFFYQVRHSYLFSFLLYLRKIKKQNKYIKNLRNKVLSPKNNLYCYSLNNK